MATFTDFVFDASIENPPLLGVSLSGAANEVVLNSSTGTLSGKAVVGLLYNSVAASSATVSLSATDGTDSVSFRVNKDYHGSSFAFYFADGSSTLFTVNTAVGRQVISNPIAWDNRGPKERRRFALEG